MAKVEIYTKATCGYCWRAKALLDQKRIEYTEYAVDFGGPVKQTMIGRAKGRMTVPQIFIDERHVGGCDDLLELERSGQLDALVGAAGLMPRIALFQSNTGIDPAANARQLADAVEQAASSGAEMLFTPEMSGLLDRDSARAAGILRSEAEDQVLAAVREAARAHGIWIHLGSLAVRLANGKVANRGFVIDGDGQVKASYDKIHLFDVDLPTGESWRESSVYSAGTRAALVERSPVGKLGLTICYDLRFPALFERISEAGADVISVPAAFTVPTGKAHWHVLLRARAIEAGLFVVAAAQVGRHEDGRETFGHSLVIDPWGEVLLDMGERQGLGFADIDLARISDVRSRIPALQHRRPIPSLSDG